MAKKKPLKKDRLAGNHRLPGERNQPFYVQAQQKKKGQPQKKKHPFGDGWELVDTGGAPP